MQWFGRPFFYRHGISTPYLTNSVKALKEQGIKGKNKVKKKQHKCAAVLQSLTVIRRISFERKQLVDESSQ